MPQAQTLRSLPVPLTSLIGREEEIATVRQLLSDRGESARLVTLIGAAGSGKTRLAISVGRQMRDAFGDGIGWVDLSLVMDGRLIGQAVANALQVKVKPQEEMTSALVEHLRPKACLLILDNCEQVIESCAQLVQQLLSACPGLQILATSRESFRLPGERVWLTPLLPVPRRGTMPPLDELLTYPGIRLWMERARAADPGFRLTPENAQAVVQVCQRLDGMPLAIELAAARVKVLSVEQIAARLDDRFRLLRADMRTVLPRNQTLRATIDWSYALLSESERLLLQCLSVFVGGCVLDAVEAVSAEVLSGAEEPALDLLTRLVEKSLVVVGKQEGASSRYYLLESIRQYGLEKAREAGIENSLRRRHREWSLQRAESLFPRSGGVPSPHWLAEMDGEYENFQAAMEWSLQTPGEGVAGLRLANLMRHYWDRKGYVQEACYSLQKVLAHPENSAPSTLRAEALNCLGFFTLLHGDSATATTFYEDALAIGEQMDDAQMIALNCAGLVFVLAGSADPQIAEPYIEKGLAAARRINDSVRVYNMLYYASWLALAKNDYPQAHALLAESLQLMRAANDVNMTGAALWRLGHLCWLEGYYPPALAAFQESLTLRRSVNNRRGVAYSIDGVAWVVAAQGDHPLAARLFGAADIHFTAMHSHFHPLEQPAHDAAQRLARGGLGDAAFAQGWEEGRRKSLEEASALALGVTLGAPNGAGVVAAPPAPPRLKLYALGAGRVLVGDRPIAASDWTYARAKELLFYLATEGPASREQIGLIFWPDASPEQLRRNLGVTLHHLRKALGDSEWVIFEKESYRFNRGLGHWYDVERFADLRQQAERADDPPALLEEAAALYQGDFLADAGVGEWYLPRRAQLAQQYEALLFSLAGLRRNGGELAAAAALYRRAIGHDPYQEAAYRELMACLAQMGERAQALRVYAELARVMKKEFAAQPSAETQALFERLRGG